MDFKTAFRADGCNVYILSVEHVEMRQFHHVCAQLQSRGTLRHIVVDEAHLTKMGPDFWPSLRRMQYALTDLTA